MPFSPSDISGLRLWLKADAIVGLNDGDPVSTWSDSSGNGFNATQSGTARPLYKTNIQNSLPVVRFDGSNDFMAGSISGLATNGAATVFVACKITDAAANRALFDSSATGATNTGPMLFLATTSTLMDYRTGQPQAAQYTFTTFLNQFHIQMGQHSSPSNKDIYLDGTFKDNDTTAQNYTAPTAYQIGALFLPTGFLLGDIAEVIVYDSAISAADRIQVENYLGTKWNVAVASKIIEPTDSLNNWEDSISVVGNELISLADDLNNLTDSVTIGLAAAVSVVLADDLNNLSDEIQVLGVGLVAPIDNLDSWQDALSILGVGEVNLSDDLNQWADAISYGMILGQELADDLNNWQDSISLDLAESQCLPITSYSYSTFAQAKTLLAGRLSDPSKVFWVDAELGLYLQESIRTWAMLSGFYSKRCTFNTVAGQFFYDLPTVLGDPTDMGYTVLDQDLVKLIQYHLIEPATGTTWSTGTGQTDQFNLADVTNALEKRRNDFLLKTGCRIAQLSITPPSPVRRVSLTDSVIDVRRVDWLVASTGLRQIVRRGDEWSSNAFDRGWQAGSALPPSSFSLILTPPIVLQFLPPSTVAPTQIDLLTVSTGANLNPAAGVLIGVPDNLSPYIKWGAMADMLGKDGQARDPFRADYCQKRYLEGVEITKVLASVEQVIISNSNLWINSLTSWDGFNYGWQNTQGTPTTAMMAGWNLLALSDVPDGVYTVTVDFVPNAPVPTLDADLIQIGRENLDIILDYAEHLAAFKMSGDEFKATIPHYDRMVESALNNNARLRAISDNLAELRGHPIREEGVNPRKSEAA